MHAQEAGLNLQRQTDQYREEIKEQKEIISQMKSNLRKMTETDVLLQQKLEENDVRQREALANIEANMKLEAEERERE